MIYHGLWVVCSNLPKYDFLRGDVWTYPFKEWCGTLDPTIIYIMVNSKVMHKSGKIRVFNVSSASKRSYRLSGDPSIVVSDQALSEVLFMVLFVNIG